ncbi:hypothetical protein ROG8370_02686 [Roseovarius gaetbuli]|uniref:Uncharacterized protein n=1 Tax=Roseovarius gaetbuli TaxID=1356575 RepID=A0A1X6ZQT8_9RHOB|nr:hypothetical protein ROG8370_02686 [Roseovarius gaetbuli]
MSKGRKCRYEQEKRDARWVVVYQDTFSWDDPDPPNIVMEPLPIDDAYEEMLRLKGSLGYVFGYLYLTKVKF